MQKGGKIRYHTWWHGRFLHIPGTSKILDESDKDSTDMFYLEASDWEIYEEYVTVKNPARAIWFNRNGTLFTAPLNQDGTISHLDWAELQDSKKIADIKDQLGPSNER